LRSDQGNGIRICAGCGLAASKPLVAASSAFVATPLRNAARECQCTADSILATAIQPIPNADDSTNNQSGSQHHQANNFRKHEKISSK
jgi:hypothetical protein